MVPQVLRNEILDALHNGIAGGHLGEDKTLGKLKEHFYWLGYIEDARRWCQTCTDCAARKSPAPRNRAKLVNIHSGYPLQLVAMDILHCQRATTRIHMFWLSVTILLDTQKRMLYLIRRQKLLHTSWSINFLRFSLPEQLHSDQG